MAKGKGESKGQVREQARKGKSKQGKGKAAVGSSHEAVGSLEEAEDSLEEAEEQGEGKQGKGMEKKGKGMNSTTYLHICLVDYKGGYCLCLLIFPAKSTFLKPCWQHTYSK